MLLLYEFAASYNIVNHSKYTHVTDHVRTSLAGLRYHIYILDEIAIITIARPPFTELKQKHKGYDVPCLISSCLENLRCMHPNTYDCHLEGISLPSYTTYSICINTWMAEHTNGVSLFVNMIVNNKTC